MTLRLVTLNLKGLHEWFGDRQKIAGPELSKLAPDILCLQEAAVQETPEFYDQAADLGKALSLSHRCFASYGHQAFEAPGATQVGLAIVSRWPFTRTRVRFLPRGDGGDTRIGLIGEVAHPEGTLAVINTHLSWQPDREPVREAQIRVLRELMEAAGWDQPGARAVLAGDFNASEQEGALQALGKKLTDTYRFHHPEGPGFTWIRANPRVAGADRHLPDRRVDYVFCPTGIRIRQANVVLDQPAPGYVSDHFGVLAELAWVP